MILASANADQVLQTVGGVESSLWLSSTGGVWHVYDPETGTTSPVAIDGVVMDRPHTFLADGRVIGQGQGHFWIRALDGTMRLMLPTSAE